MCYMTVTDRTDLVVARLGRESQSDDGINYHLYHVRFNMKVYCSVSLFAISSTMDYKLTEPTQISTLLDIENLDVNLYRSKKLILPPWGRGAYISSRAATFRSSLGRN
jgi:hypothetical protein